MLVVCMGLRGYNLDVYLFCVFSLLNLVVTGLFSCLFVRGYYACFILVCFGLGLAAVSSPVVDFLLGFYLCRLKNHPIRGYRTEFGWIFPSPIFGFFNEPLVCSIGACNSSRCRKFAHIGLLPEFSVRFTST